MTLQRRDFLRSAGSVVLTGLAVAEQDKAPPKRIKIGQIGVGHAHASKLVGLSQVARLRGRRHRRAGRGAAEAGRGAGRLSAG